MKKLTSKQFVEKQIINIGEKTSISIEYGKFAESTIRKAISSFGYYAKIDECGNMFAVKK